MTFYNDNEPYVAQWCRNLMEAGHISKGVVSEKNIKDLRASDLEGYNRCHFFAGIAGWELALQIAGWPEGREVFTGSCPCQSFSVAGKGRGATDERHLWPYWLPLIAERRPATLFLEQVDGAIAHGWLDEVITDLEREGYTCWPTVLSARSIGALIIRKRLFLVAFSAQQSRSQSHQTAKANSAAPEVFRDQSVSWQALSTPGWETDETFIASHIDGIPCRVEQVCAIGNSIVPQLAATFIRAFMDTEQ